MNKYKELADLYKEMYELVWNHFIDANELVLDHDYCINDAVLTEYNEADDVVCANLKELQKKAKELEEAIAMDEDQKIYKEAKQAANKDM